MTDKASWERVTGYLSDIIFTVASLHTRCGESQSCWPTSSGMLRVISLSTIPNDTVREHVNSWLSHVPWLCQPLIDSISFCTLTDPGEKCSGFTWIDLFPFYLLTGHCKKNTLLFHHLRYFSFLFPIPTYSFLSKYSINLFKNVCI